MLLLYALTALSIISVYFTAAMYMLSLKASTHWRIKVIFGKLFE